jgi:hypothetical protein
VRCGKCGDIFNALAHLAEDPSTFTAVETEIELEFRADSILESPAPMTPGTPPESVEEFAPPGVEIARLQVLDWNEHDSADELADEPSGDLAGDLAGELADDDTSMEFTLPPGELDRIFVENKKSAPRPAPQGPSQEAPLPPHPEDAGILRAAAPSGFEVSEDVRNPEDAGILRAAAPSGLEVSEDVRNEMLSGMESPAIARPVRRLASPFAPAPQDRRSFIPWLIAAIASALLLTVQVVHQNREWLAAHSPLGGTLRALYSTIGAPVSPLANLSAYQLRQWGVTGDPAGEGTLRVRASILNTTAQLEPFPLLRVTLANRFGGSIGARDFEASEYLGKPTARLLAPGERVDATMDILDPGKSAEGFEIDVCLRGADRKISCANDTAPAQAKR